MHMAPSSGCAYRDLTAHRSLGDCWTLTAAILPLPARWCRRNHPTAYRQNYIPNTNILTTTVALTNGDAFQITDFCPSSSSTAASIGPPPLQGTPAIQVSCRPISGWDKTVVTPVRGSNHLRYGIRGEPLRLLTNMPSTIHARKSWSP